MAGKKKKSKASLIVWAFLISLALTISLTPIMRLVYPLSYIEEIEKYSETYNLDKYLVMGIISAESGFDPSAQSHKDAKGLMQVKEETAKWLSETMKIEINAEDITDPDANINIGCAYMRYLIDRYGGHEDTAVAAYNAGPGNADKWLSDTRYSKEGKVLFKIPFYETEEYVKKVQKRREIYQKLYDTTHNTAQK